MNERPLLSQAWSDVVSMETIEREAWLDLYAAVSAEYAERCGLAFARLGTGAVLAIPSMPSATFNRALCLGIDSPVTEADIDHATAWLKRHGKAWALQIAPDARPTAVHRWLEARGLTPSGTGWAKFQRDAFAPRSPAFVGPLRVRPVQKKEAPNFARVVQEGFGLPAWSAGMFSVLVERPRWFTYLAYDGDIPVGAGAMFVDSGRAWLGVDTTLSDYQGRGAQTALIAHRILDGINEGVSLFSADTVQPSAGGQDGNSSYRNYNRAGFRVLYVRPNYRPAP